MATNGLDSDDPPERLTRARLTSVAVWTSALLVAGFAVVRALGVETGYPLVPLVAYTPVVAVAALVLATVLGAMRRWIAAVLVAAAAVVLVANVLPRAIPGQDSEAQGPSLRVMTANIKFGEADARELARLVRRKGVELLSVQELTPNAVGRLRRAGLMRSLPHHALDPAPKSSGGGLLSAMPLRRVQGGASTRGRISLPRARLEVPEAIPVEVSVVHPPPPISSGDVDRWEGDLEALPGASLRGPARMLLGDFNATLDHARLRELIASGYVDAADAKGGGLAPTWPVGRLLPPPVTIDHVLVDQRIQVAEVSIHDLEGTDHRAVMADVVLPAEGDV